MFSLIKNHKFLFFFLALGLFVFTIPVFAAKVTPAVTETTNTYIVPKQLFQGDFFSSFLESVEPALIGTYDQEGNLTKEGVLGSLNNVIVSFYAPNVIDTQEYAKDVGKDLGLITPAYAAITGYEHLSPVMEIWKITRDAAYVLFIIIFIAVGFMIMLRKRVDARTVISVQGALPNIVLALILVTFSYAIAGLVIDLTEVLTEIVAVTLLGHGVSSSWREVLKNNTFSLVWPFHTAVVSFTGQEGVTSSVDAATKAMSQGVVGTITKVIANGAARVVLFVVLLFTMFKLFFALLGSYVAIILSTIIGPFQLLLSAIPGQSKEASKWFKTLLANALSFPAFLAVLAIAALVANINTPPYNIQASPIPTGDTWAPALLPFADIINGLLGFGIVMFAPSVPGLVKQGLQAGDVPGMAAAGQETKSAASRVPFVGGFMK